MNSTELVTIENPQARPGFPRKTNLRRAMSLVNSGQAVFSPLDPTQRTIALKTMGRLIQERDSHERFEMTSRPTDVGATMCVGPVMKTRQWVRGKSR